MRGEVMKIEELEYSADTIKMKGYLAVEEGASKLPAVIVAHAWRGQDDFAREKAVALAKMGYVGFAADLYGDGQVATNDDEALALMQPLFIERSELRKRIVAAYSALQNHQAVDSSKIAAIGFCFGGLTVIELLRSGVSLSGVVSFHGVLGSTLGTMQAQLAKANLPMKGSLLLLHGHEDPLVSAQDLTAIQQEFTEAKVDWQLHIYGGAVHAFSNPLARDRQHGMLYNKKACVRSWQAMTNFLQELFTNEAS
jgi:dienelactone hydrolase